VHDVRQNWFKPIFPLFLTWLLIPMVDLSPPPPPFPQCCWPIYAYDCSVVCSPLSNVNSEFSILVLHVYVTYTIWFVIRVVLFNRNNLVSVRVTLRNGSGASLVFPSASLTLSKDTSCTDNCPVPLLLWFCFQALLCANLHTLSPNSFLRWFAIAEANSYLQQNTAPTT